MRRSSTRLLSALALVLLASHVPPARAGQERVTVAVGGGLSFTPSNVTVNTGDHVVWVWAFGGHTVTSGNPNAPTPTGNGLFRSSTAGIAGGNTFAWKSTGPGAFSYYCLPHAPGMAGTVNVVASGADVADFRITEVEYAAGGGLDRIQITNLGTDIGFLGSYRLSYDATGVPQTIPFDAVVSTNSSVTIHLNATGTSTSSNIFMPASPELGTQGAIGLYVPNTTAFGSTSPAALTDPAQMIDFVEWGSPAQAGPNEATAASAMFWSSGAAVPTDAQLPGGGSGYSIAFCGTRADHGAGFWQISRPNFGTSALCSTPTRNPSWGRIKQLYR